MGQNIRVRAIGRIVCWLLVLLIGVAGAAQAQTVTSIVHPGGFYSAADIAYVRAKLAANAQPWTSASAAVLALSPTTAYQPNPTAVVMRDKVNSTGRSQFESDVNNAYILMMKWMATNDITYADAAIRVLDGWSATLTTLSGSDIRLLVGIVGSKFAQAAELAAYAQPSWPNKARAQGMFRNLFYPVIKDGASANWGTSCMVGIASMGVFCNDTALINQSIRAYKFGFPGPDGCAGVTQYIDTTGENAESGRDQPHSQGGIGHLLEVAVCAYNQGVNLFTYGNNRIVTGFEYTAKYNLGYEVPYAPFQDCSAIIYPNGISDIGRAGFSPMYEMGFNFFERVGQAAPYTKMVALQYAPEGTVTDHVGLGTLTFRRAPAATTAQTITFPAIPTKVFDGPDFGAGATASSGLAVSYSSSNPRVATISATGQVHIEGGGTATIYAYQLGNGTYAPAPIASRVLTVNRNPCVRIEAEDFSTATGTIRTETTQDVDGDLNLSFVSTGSYTAFNNLDFTGTAPLKFFARSAISGGATTLEIHLDTQTGPLVGTLQLASTGGNQVWRTDSIPLTNGPTGIHSIYLVYGAQVNLNWLRFGNSLKAQTISFPAFGAATTATADINPGATTTSGLALTYTSSNAGVAVVTAGNKLHITGAGTATITASQAGNATYNPALSVSRTLTVTAATASAPYAANTVPGVIEAENYDYGGEGLAYHDVSGDNANAYRNGDKIEAEYRDTPARGSASNGVNLAYVVDTEWLNYTLNVQQAGTYSMVVRHSLGLTAGTARSIALTLDGAALGTFTLTASGSNSTFVTNSFSVSLPAGKHVLRVLMGPPGSTTVQNNMNLDSFTLTRTGARALATASAQLKEQVTVYPNPANGQVQVLLPASLSSMVVEASLVNALGQVVQVKELPVAGGTKRNLSLLQVAAGIYTLQLKTAAGLVTKRLVVE